jgi:isoamyl acetate esterase
MIRNKNVFYFAAGFGVALTSLSVLNYIFFKLRSSPNSYGRKKVVAFGDSITQHGFNTDIHGWVAKLADWWSRRVDLVNRGFSGYNSRWGLLAFEKVIIPENPDLLLIFFGANDAIEASAVHHVPLLEYAENLRKIIKAAKRVS